MRAFLYRLFVVRTVHIVQAIPRIIYGRGDYREIYDNNEKTTDTSPQPCYSRSVCRRLLGRGNGEFQQKTADILR